VARNAAKFEDWRVDMAIDPDAARGRWPRDCGQNSPPSIPPTGAFAYNCANVKNLRFLLDFEWSGREDLNLRPPGPEPEHKSFLNLGKKERGKR
jgi:hypothetical protein